MSEKSVATRTKARRLRREHSDWTYDQIADHMGVSRMTVWNACNPERAAKHSQASVALKRTVVIPDGVWESLKARGVESHVGISKALVAILVGEQKPLT